MISVWREVHASKERSDKDVGAWGGYWVESTEGYWTGWIQWVINWSQRLRRKGSRILTGGKLCTVASGSSQTLGNEPQTFCFYLGLSTTWFTLFIQNSSDQIIYRPFPAWFLWHTFILSLSILCQLYYLKGSWTFLDEVKKKINLRAEALS